MQSEGTCQPDQGLNSSPTPPTKASAVFPADGSESPRSRPSTLHKQPPALPPKPFSRLPNHITGKLFSVHESVSMFFFLILPPPFADGTPVKLPCMSAKLSPPLPPKKLLISIPAGSMEPSPLAFQKCPGPPSHTGMGGHSLQYGVLPVPLHPPSRIIEELNKTLALTMQRFERCGCGNHKKEKKSVHVQLHENVLSFKTFRLINFVSEILNPHMSFLCLYPSVFCSF